MTTSFGAAVAAAGVRRGAAAARGRVTLSSGMGSCADCAQLPLEEKRTTAATSVRFMTSSSSVVGDDAEVRTAVPVTTLNGPVVRDRPIGAVAHGDEACGIEAVAADQVLDHAARALLRERLVGGAPPDRVGVALHANVGVLEDPD